MDIFATVESSWRAFIAKALICELDLIQFVGKTLTHLVEEQQPELGRRTCARVISSLSPAYDFCLDTLLVAIAHHIRLDNMYPIHVQHEDLDGILREGQHPTNHVSARITSTPPTRRLTTKVDPPH